jgi:hypothetical protein
MLTSVSSKVTQCLHHPRNCYNIKKTSNDKSILVEKQGRKATGPLTWQPATKRSFFICAKVNVDGAAVLGIRQVGKLEGRITNRQIKKRKIR